MTCHDDTDCIDWEPDPVGGSPTAELVVSARVENDLACLPDGTFSPKTLQVVNCETFPAVAADGVPSGAETVLDTGVATLTNPTDDRVMHCIINLNLGAVRITTNPGVEVRLLDFYKIGDENVGAISFADPFALLGYTNGNTSVLDKNSAFGFPGRALPIVVCPDLAPGQSLGVRYQRRALVSGTGGGLSSWLLQPTLIWLWGIIV